MRSARRPRKAVFDIEVLDIDRAYPEGALHLGDQGEDFLEVGFVGDVPGHVCKGNVFPSHPIREYDGNLRIVYDVCLNYLAKYC